MPFEKELPALLEKCISGLVSEAIKPALKAQAKIARDFADGMDSIAERAPELVDEINNVGFDVELKVNVEINFGVCQLLDSRARSGRHPGPIRQRWDSLATA